MKYFASDIDGTLIKVNGNDTTRSILNEDIEALKTWTKNHYLIISTGRNQISCFKSFDYINLYLPNTFYMTSNGAEVYDANRNRLFQQTLSSTSITKVIPVLEDLLKSYTLEICVFDGEVMEVVTDGKDLANYEHVVNIGLTILNKSIDDTKICTTRIEQVLSGLAEVHQNNWYIDIVPLGISKATTLQYITNQMMQDHDAYLVAIGDGANDVCMFEVADTSYTFNFASSDVQQAANCLVNHVYEAVALELEK